MAASGTVHGLRESLNEQRANKEKLLKKEVWKNGVSMRLYGCGHYWSVIGEE